MLLRIPTTAVIAVSLGAGLLASAPASRPTSPLALAQSDLDAFMQKVLAKRDENWKKLQQYVLEENEHIEVRGPSKVPIWGERRDYSWFIKEGFFIRSPVKVNGVSISDAERRKAEDAYLKQQKERDKRRASGAQNGEPAQDTPQIDRSPADAKDMGGMIMQTRQPEFMDSAYFLRFKFEQSKYALVGRETLDGVEMLKVEYYPARLFSHEQDKLERRQQQPPPSQTPPEPPPPGAKVKPVQSERDQQASAQIEKMMNKVSLITLWIEPKAYQIVKYTFDNVNMDFLPAAWLMRMDDLKASMTMSQPFKDVWLPKDVDMYFSAMFAVGLVDVHYRLDYHDYREASTSSRIRGGNEK